MHSPARGRALVLLLGAMVLAGAAQTGQARINGELAVRLGSPLAAAGVNFAVGLVLLVALAAARRAPFSAVVRKARSTRWWYWLGGLCGVVAMWSMTAGVPRLGVAMVGVSMAAGMATGGLAADRSALAGPGHHSLSWTRIVGALLAVAAVGIAGADGLRGSSELPYVLFCVAGGFVLAYQQPVNGCLRAVLEEPVLAAVVSFTVGLLGLAVLLTASSPALDWPREPWLYLGGAIGAGYVVTGIVTVRRLGALRLSLATIGGQLGGAAVLDGVVPIGGNTLTGAKVLGAAVALVAVALASGLWVRLHSEAERYAEEAA